MKTIKLIIILALFFILSCDEESNQKPVPIDPCAAAIQKSADFKTFEYNSFADTMVETSNFLFKNNIIFEATHKCKTYEWLVGDDTTRRYTRDFVLRFNKAFKNVGVRLITTWDKDTCLPNDPGIDTSYSYLNFFNVGESALIGEYKVVDENFPLDTFIFEIEYKRWFGWSDSTDNYFFNNLPNGCPNVIVGNYDFPRFDENTGYNFMYVESSAPGVKNCAEKAHILLKDNNEIYIKYSNKWDFSEISLIKGFKIK